MGTNKYLKTQPLSEATKGIEWESTNISQEKKKDKGE
jgi:hypothetical protein